MKVEKKILLAFFLPLRESSVNQCEKEPDSFFSLVLCSLFKNVRFSLVSEEILEV